MLGWTREEIETKFDNKFLNMVHPEDRDVIDGYVNCLLTTQEGEMVQERTYRLLGKDGYHWVADNSMHMDIGGKRVFQGFLSDITPFMEEKEKEKTEQENVRINQLSVLENQLSAQRQYLDILSRKYILVYYVDLAEDLGNVLKLDMHANVWRMPKMRPGTYFSYEAHIKKFAERFVLDTDKKKFQEMLHKDYIESCLKTTARFTFRFNSVPNLVGNQHYKIYVMRANPDQYDGKVMVISEEIDDVISMEQQQKAELDMERRYLKVLTKDFAVVYHVKLEENTSKLIKVDETNSKKEAKKISLRELNDYQERVELYSQKFVVPALRKEFCHVMDAKHIRRRLRNANRFAYRYRTMFGEKGQQYFEMIAMRMDEEKECKDALIAFRRIDEVVTAEQQRQIELEERLEEERNQNEILSALGKIYHAIFQIDLLSDTYTEVSCREELRHYFNGEETSAGRTLANLCDEIIDERYRKSMREFFDLNTLVKRLRHQEFVERECITKDGNWHRARMIVKRREKNGRVTHVLYVTQVIDDEKRYEEHLIARADHADLANRAKTEFISQVAHDIRTPMNSIFGFLEIAEGSMGDWEKIKYSLGKIRAAGEFLKDLVNDVLDVSRMERGKMKFYPQPMNLTEELNEFAISMKTAKFNKQQEFQINIHDMIHDQVMTDPLRLKQIYANILSNAIKYTPDGGNIGFEVYQEESAKKNKVRLIAIITDDGIGMTEEFMERMFDKFERATDTRVNEVSGYGLGMSIVKQLVDMMDGSVQIESELGKGTRVQVELEVPYVERIEKIEKSEEKSFEDYLALCKGMHLLVAEDNELNREVITELLAMYEVTCDCTEDGKLCLECIEHTEGVGYDAILMDMQMPNMNGVEAAQRIRKLPFVRAKTIPIIAMTANALKEDVERCLEAGMDCHMSKPVNIEQLLKTLCEVTQKEKNK